VAATIKTSWHRGELVFDIAATPSVLSTRRRNGSGEDAGIGQREGELEQL
jgi:hypothetical protein